MISMVEENFSEDSANESPILEEEKFDVVYECLRCKVQVSMIELNRLPEIKCICGFRVFTKVRPPLVTTVKAL
ncbi:MAG TPA: RNA polymerase Rbp10 [Candidatus Nitrosopelagicus sp.]|nr:RNA polymerase Rbp10 [Candidatus Nitrosopelagicus sp.]